MADIIKMPNSEISTSEEINETALMEIAKCSYRAVGYAWCWCIIIAASAQDSNADPDLWIVIMNIIQ